MTNSTSDHAVTGRKTARVRRTTVVEQDPGYAEARGDEGVIVCDGDAVTLTFLAC